MKCIYDAIVEALNSTDVKVNCSCLFGGTHISLLDGTKPTIEELLVRFNNEEDLWVYSVDENGDFKPGHIEKVWITKQVTRGIKITLDNGAEINTTPDHLYMTRTGEYRPAEELDIGDSLMPLYFKISNKGYDLIKINSTNKYTSVYKYIADELKEDEILNVKSKLKSRPTTKVKYDVAIHHKDFNKHNNHPDNLLVMTGDDHWEYHNSLKFENKPWAVQEQIREKIKNSCYKKKCKPN